jgi:hypothetical protein
MHNLKQFVFLIAIVAAGCLASPPTESAESTGAVRFALPAHTPIPDVACAAPALQPPLRLHGNPSAIPPVWLTLSDQRHIPIVWPEGYYATFTPALEVHAPDGTAIAREGDDASTDPRSWPGLFVCASEIVTTVYESQ